MALEPKEILDKALKLPLAVRAGILAGFYILAVGLYYVGFYTDQEKVLATKTAAYQQLHTKLVQTQSIASQIDTFIEEVENLKEQLAQAQDQLPLEARKDVLIDQVTRIGKDNGLAFTKIVPGNETQKGFYAEIPISFEMTGKYHAFGLFFSELAGQTRIINVSGLSLKREDPKALTLKASFQAMTYRQVQTPPKEAAPAAGQKTKAATPGKQGQHGTDL